MLETPDTPAAIPVAAFSDNYIWLLPLPDNDSSRRVIIVDPGDARPVFDTLGSRGLEPAAVLITHHHFDHTGGVRELIARYPVPVYGPAGSPVQGVDHPLREGARFGIGEHLEFEVLAVPGHTLDHIAYYGNGILMCGDTLFAGGCGRLFEGTAKQLHQSLQKLAALPGDTLVYCAHEYTEANLTFALEVEPHNDTTRSRFETVRRQRHQGLPTIPSTLNEECSTNPFLRCAEPEVIRSVGNHASEMLTEEVEVFAALRRWKDGFRPRAAQAPPP